MSNYYDPKLIETHGDLGIYKTFLNTYCVANMKTQQICTTLNFMNVEDAREYIEDGVEYF